VFRCFPRNSSGRDSCRLVQQTSGVTGENIYSVSAVSKTTAWAAAGYDGLLKTTDGGATWKKQNLPDEGVSVSSVSAVNGQVVWVAGYNVYLTTNGGLTWKKVLEGGSGAHHGEWPGVVAAVDSKTAWAGILYFMYYEPPGIYMWAAVKTEDGGATWSDGKFLGVNHAGPPPCGLCAVDRSTAWGASMGIDTSGEYYKYHPVISKTNPGEDWNLQFDPTLDFSYLADVDASDHDNAWAVGGFSEPASGVVLHTSDGGTGWQSQDSHAGSGLAGVSAVDSKVAWAVGTGGTIIKTTDGETWEPQASGVATDLRAVEAVDAQTAWAVGADGVILHTTDGGGAPGAFPDLQSVTPNEAETEMTLQGSGFGTEPGSLVVQMGKAEYNYGYPVVKEQWSLDNFTSWSDEEIRCVLPTAEEGISPGVYEVVLKDGNLTSSKRFFSLGQFSAVTSLTPYSGANNSTVDVTMHGYGFDAPNLGVQVSNASASIPVSDVVVVSPTELTCRLDLTGQPAGKYDVSISGDYTTIAYLNGFTVLEPRVYRITPGSAANISTVSVSISGVGFLPGAIASLENGSTVINATDVVVKSSSLMTCKFNLQNKPLGKYDVIVENPDGQKGTLAGGFTVTNACGQSAAISVSLFAGLLGLLSAAGFGWRRKRK
jgi:photosystem II stability/assembly factor-like uncharacterized protein